VRFSVVKGGAVCCGVLQCVAGLHCVAVCCSVLQCIAVWHNVLQCVTVRCNLYQSEPNPQPQSAPDQISEQSACRNI